MRTLATNELNDIYIDTSGKIAVAVDLEACKQSCEHASQVLLGELPYAQTRGIAFFDVGFTSSPQLAIYESQLRAILISVPNVVKVLSIGFDLDGTDLKYEAQIQTTFGLETINGSL